MSMSNALSLFPISLLLFSIIVSGWQPHRPNIILLMTDDQDIELGSMQFMPKTQMYLGERGVTFESAFVSTPICCPSRTSILTGLYVHNHHVFTNNQNCSGTEWRNVFEKRTLGVFLKDAGYTTAYFGKYLNEYDASYVPPGWDEWMGLLRNSRFYNYTVNFNGEKIKHGFSYEKDYFTDLILNDSISFIHRHREKHPKRPFMSVLSFPAPHGPEDPAPQYSDWFPDIETHRTESWNYAPNPDKQWLLQHTGRMEPIHVVFTDVLHRRRLQTLQSVDHNVHRLINELRDLGELANTYIIYTSDHGYHLGQYGLVKGKNMPYEFDIRVPFIIRGPAIPKNITIRSPVMNVDIAPTILDMAGVAQPDYMDGRSLLPLMHAYGLHKGKFLKESEAAETAKWRHTVLIERGKMARLTRIRDRLQRQHDRFSKDARIQAACLRPEFRAPCVQDQHWKCVQNDSGKWRIFKCQEDVHVAKDCECRRSRKKRRNARTPRNSRAEKVSFRRIATIAELDREGEEVNVDDALTKRWESEFLHFIQQKEIVESGQWFQGVFGDNETSRRTIRDVLKRFKKERERNFGPKCTHFNTTLLCEPIVFEDSRVWALHKTRVDDRIENLRRRLSAFKDVRRALKRGRPHAGEEDSEGSSNCVCATPQAHPLKNEEIWKEESDENEPSDGDSRRHTVKAEEKASFSKWLRDDGKRNCNVPQMNCFVHRADHWRTPPLWPALYGEFCFCQNSNNNTYWCLRTVNDTHNFLYCEFITEFVSYYDLNTDPYQLHNAVWSVPVGILEQLSSQLEKLRACKGHRECEHYSSPSWNRVLHKQPQTRPAT